MCRELPEAKSQGETIEELLENMKDAIKLTLEVRKEDQARRLAGRRPLYRKVRVTV
jgi:predicted RNase H-like HicB family nuclease